tara:strand:- start:12 stop:467 length:456 start_codon:yes stop_codon:yes gene_type:complete
MNNNNNTYTENPKLQAYINRYNIDIEYLLEKFKDQEDDEGKFGNVVLPCWFSSGDLTINCLEHYIAVGYCSYVEVAEKLKCEENMGKGIVVNNEDAPDNWDGFDKARHIYYPMNIIELDLDCIGGCGNYTIKEEGDDEYQCRECLIKEMIT